jgi:hypothetical protein
MGHLTRPSAIARDDFERADTSRMESFDRRATRRQAGSVKESRCAFIFTIR